MRFGYSYIQRRIANYPKRLLMAIGLIALPVIPRMERAASAEPVAPVPTTPAVKPANDFVADADPRTVRLIRFFSQLHCPVLNLAEDFIHEADENHLDWRLLPSISVIESGGGKAYRNNNIFGWNQGSALFPSVRSGIKEVAFKLGRSPLYKDRDSKAKLRLYNPAASYAQTVLSVMNRISPVVKLQPERRTLVRQPQGYAFD